MIVVLCNSLLVVPMFLCCWWFFSFSSSFCCFRWHCAIFSIAISIKKIFFIPFRSCFRSLSFYLPECPLHSVQYMFRFVVWSNEKKATKRGWLDGYCGYCVLVVTGGFCVRFISLNFIRLPLKLCRSVAARELDRSTLKIYTHQAHQVLHTTTFPTQSDQSPGRSCTSSSSISTTITADNSSSTALSSSAARSPSHTGQILYVLLMRCTYA